MTSISSAFPQPRQGVQHSFVSPEALMERLWWRYAVKEFAPDKEIPPGHWAALERALVLSPSSYGLQPWKFVLVSDKSLRRSLLTVSHGQQKVVDASKLVVFASRTAITEQDVQRWVDRLEVIRQLSRAEVNKLYTTMISDLVNGPRAAQAPEWAKRQTYLALGVFLTAAATLGIDACPMEGFDVEGYNRILNLPDRGYTATVVATAGYRSPLDHAADLPKVRFPDEVVIEER